jgi:hypothetical protein
MRSRRVVFSFLSFAFALGLAGAASGADLASVLRDAIRKYAPLVYLHPQEKYLPTSAEKLLAVTTPVGGSALRLKDPGASRGGDLAAATAYVNVKVSVDHSDVQFWFLYAYNGAGTASIALFGKTLAEFLLGSCGVHEGDWEHATLRIRNSDGKLLSVYLAQHSSGVWVTKPETLLQKDRITVFSSLNGHATYAAEGKNFSETKNLKIGEFRLVNATARGPVYDTRSHFLVIGAHDLRPGGKKDDPALLASLRGSAPEWLKYTGRWGLEKNSQEGLRDLLHKALPGAIVRVLDKVGGVAALDKALSKTPIGDECLSQAGPAPPWSKGSWLGDE